MKTLSMKYVMLAAITALAVGAAGTARADNEQSPNSAVGPAYSRAVTEVTDKTNAEAESRVASLTALLAEWDRAGFVAPIKPTQYRVLGRHGYVTSGPGYYAMVSLIRSAKNDIRKGRDHDASAKIAQARSLLAANRG
jgi:pectin methylesterase-like acyl-CoA thioesterase